MLYNELEAVKSGNGGRGDVGFNSGSDRAELTYRYLPLWAMEGVEIQKDGIAITKELYNEKIDDWLEEIYND